MSVRPEVRAVPPYHFTARPHTVKLDQNESPLDLPESLKRRVLERLEQVAFNRYPDLQAESLQAALADFHDWPEDSFVVSGGSNVLIQALVAACGIGQKVLSVTPTFSVYAMQAKLLGAELVEVPLQEDFSLPLEPLRQVLSRDEGVFFLANPAAPTGNLFPEEEVLSLIEAAAPNWTVVVDEAYHQFSGTDYARFIEAYPHVSSLRTFSKAFGLGGVRLGYLMSTPDLAEQVSKVLMPFSVSALQLAVGVTVLEHAAYVQTYVDDTVRERGRVTQALQALEGIRVFPSHTNFLLLKVGDAEVFYRGLLARGVLIRRQDHLPGLAGCVRVSIGRPEENDAFLEAAKEVLQGMLSGEAYG